MAGLVARTRQRLADLIRPAAPQLRQRRMDGATGGRRAFGFGTFGAINSEVGAAAHTLASRSAYLAANNPFISNGVANIVGSLVGPGIIATPTHPDAAVRQDLSTRFDAWCEMADADGRTDFAGLQALVANELVVRGEAFALLLQTDDGLRLRALGAEQVDRSMTRNLGGGRSIVQGVEFDADGRRVAYWIFPTRETDVFAAMATPVRVDASDVLHVMRPVAPGQVRGIPWTASIILQASEFDKLTDALLMAASVSAMFAGFVTDENNLGDGTDPFGDEAQPSLEPGTMVRLKGGQKVVFANPQQANETAEFVKHNLRALSAGLGVPTHLLDNDLSGANYSSLRAGLLPFRQRIEQVQYGVLVPQLFRPIWHRFILSEVLSGSLTADDLEASRPAYEAVDWIMPRPMQVDPQKDVEATTAEIDAGLTSRRKAVAERGWNVEDLDEERAADRTRETALGLAAEPEQREAANAA